MAPRDEKNQVRNEALAWLASAAEFDDLMKRLHGCRNGDERRLRSG